MKEFLTAAKEAKEGDEAGILHFAIDGYEITAFPPGDGQLAILMAAAAKNTDPRERMAGIINFFASVLDEESGAHTYIEKRLLDRNDKFGIEEVTRILEWMVEQWSAERPTKSSADSSQSQANGGQKSTPRTPALT